MDAKVYLWEAVSFLCVYVVYAASVWAAEMLENRHRSNSLVLDPLISKGNHLENIIYIRLIYVHAFCMKSKIVYVF